VFNPWTDLITIIYRGFNDDFLFNPLVLNGFKLGKVITHDADQSQNKESLFRSNHEGRKAQRVSLSDHEVSLDASEGSKGERNHVSLSIEGQIDLPRELYIDHSAS
jgi:hypothetical protein